MKTVVIDGSFREKSRKHMAINFVMYYILFSIYKDSPNLKRKILSQIRKQINFGYNLNWFQVLISNDGIGVCFEKLVQYT